MRILWVGKADSGGADGDQVYDRRLLRILKETQNVVHFAPKPVNIVQKMLGLFSGTPLYRATYKSKKNIYAFKKAVSNFDPDAIVISWEPFDFLATEVDRKVILVLHNVTSDAIPEIFIGSKLARLYASHVRRWEKRLYDSAHIKGLVVLSRHDHKAIESIGISNPANVISPGAPPLAPAPQDGLVRPEILISGTYNWYPKRRDLKEVAERQRGRSLEKFSIYWDHPLPTAVAPLFKGEQIIPAEWSPAIRYGLVPDSFSSGFKLKVTYYIVNNCIVLTRSSIGDDYAHIPDSDMFIRRIKNLEEIEEIHNEFMKLDSRLLAIRFQRFKEACVKHFSWERSAQDLVVMMGL